MELSGGLGLMRLSSFVLSGRETGPKKRNCLCSTLTFKTRNNEIKISTQSELFPDSVQNVLSSVSNQVTERVKNSEHSEEC